MRQEGEESLATTSRCGWFHIYLPKAAIYKPCCGVKGDHPPDLTALISCSQAQEVSFQTRGEQDLLVRALYNTLFIEIIPGFNRKSCAIRKQHCLHV